MSSRLTYKTQIFLFISGNKENFLLGCIVSVKSGSLEWKKKRFKKVAMLSLINLVSAYNKRMTENKILPHSPLKELGSCC